MVSSGYHGFRAGKNGPAAPVLARTSFSQGQKIKVNFDKKQAIKISTSVMFGLVGLILLGYNGWRRYMKRFKIIGCPHIMLSRYSVVQKAK